MLEARSSFLPIDQPNHGIPVKYVGQQGGGLVSGVGIRAQMYLNV